MIIQEPIKATISFALENYAYSDAIFLSERLHAEVSTDESLFLLATSYYRSGKPNVAYLLLSAKHSKFCKSPQCLFLLSRCCFELKKYTEAMDTLTGPFFSGDIAPNKERILSKDDLTQFYGELASFVAQILGTVAVKLDFAEMAAHYYTVSLKINPFLWSSFEKLVQLEPSDVECNKLLTLDNFEFKYSCGTNPLISLLNSSGTLISPPPPPLASPPTNNSNLAALSNQNHSTATNCLFDNTNTSHIQTPPINQQQQLPNGLRAKIEISTPYAVIKQSVNESNKLDVITPETNGCWRTLGCVAPAKNQNQAPAKVGRKVSSFALKSLCNIESTQSIPSNNNNTTTNTNKTSSTTNQQQPTTINTNVSKNLLNMMESPVVSNRHTFGTLQLDEESLSLDEIQSEKDLANANSNNTTTNVNKTTQRNTIGLALHDSTSPAPVKKPHTRTRNNQQDLQEVSANINPPTTGVLRRSSRLYSGSNWVKENASSPKTTKITRTPTKRSRRTISFEKSADQKELSDLSKPNVNSLLNTKGQALIDLTKAGIKVQRSSAFGLIELMTKFGSAYKLLSQFKCKEAVEEFKRLSSNHLNTGYVLTSIGRAYFEMGKYDDAIFYFRKCHQLEPYRLQGKEIYSTALWHQQKEVDLSCLAQEMIEFDKNAPETWCVAGNCFSLQKEHEISIKFLKRAIQVDSDFSYAYTLLGHELVSADELDNAMACFRNATRLDRRHYNAWYGIGMIYYKQEKYQYAYINYKRALDISAYNPILMCHLAIVAHHLKKSSNAISLLEEASKLDPNNALVKFHLASIYFNNEKYSLALEELEQLKQIVPKESMVYFLIGKIHKIRGDTHLALMNFSWAMDLDPKGASNQIKELIDRQYGNEEEMVIHSNNNVIGGSNGVNGSGNNNSTGTAAAGSSSGTGNASSDSSSSSAMGTTTTTAATITTTQSSSGSQHHHSNPHPHQHHSHHNNSNSSIITTTTTSITAHHNISTTTPFQQRSSLSSTPTGATPGTLTGSNSIGVVSINSNHNGSSNSNNISNNNDSNIRRNSGGAGGGGSATISSRRNNNATNIINNSGSGSSTNSTNTPNPNLNSIRYIISDVFDIRMDQDGNEIEEEEDADDEDDDDDEVIEEEEEEVEEEDELVNDSHQASDNADAGAGTSILTPGDNSSATGTTPALTSAAPTITARLRTINLTPLTLTPTEANDSMLSTNEQMVSFGEDDEEDDEDLLEEEEEEPEETDEDNFMQF